MTTPAPTATVNPDGSRRGYIAPTAYVADTAYVSSNATVTGHARVFGHARVLAYAHVTGGAHVADHATVSGRVWVEGHARIARCAHVAEHAWVGGRAVVTGAARVSGHAYVSGHARVRGSARVTGTAYVIRRSDLAHGSTGGYTWTAYRTTDGAMLRYGCELHPLDAWRDLHETLAKKHETLSHADVTRAVEALVRAALGVPDTRPQAEPYTVVLRRESVLRDLRRRADDAGGWLVVETAAGPMVAATPDGAREYADDHADH